MKTSTALKEYSGFLAETTENNELFFKLLGVGKEKYCRYLWIRRVIDNEIDHVNKWLTIGKVKKGESDLQDRSDIFKAVAKEMPGQDTVDYFISPNEFFGWRCAKGVSRLHANYIDIDTISKRTLSEIEQQTIIKEVFDRLGAAEIALPNAVVKSGSGGLHLYWVYEPTEAYRWKVAYWKEFTEKVIESLGEAETWKVDSQASLDPSRVLRLPGSRHNKSKRRVKAYVLEGSRFDFDVLYKSVGVNAERPSYIRLVPETDRSVSDSEKRKSAKTNRSKAQLRVYQNNGKHNIRRWWRKVYEYVKHECIHYGVKEGQRDYAAFILYVAQLNCCDDKEEAFEIIKKDNGAFIHLSDKEIASFLSTAKAKKYKYKKESLAKFLETNLNIDTSFLFVKSDKKVRLTPAQIKEEQRQSALTTASKKRKSTLSHLRCILMSLVKTTTKITVNDVVETSGLSRRTVYRYWEDIQHDFGVIRSLSI